MTKGLGLTPEQLRKCELESLAYLTADEAERTLKAADKYLATRKPINPMLRAFLGRLIGTTILLVTVTVGAGTISILRFSAPHGHETKLERVFEIIFTSVLGFAVIAGLFLGVCFVGGSVAPDVLIGKAEMRVSVTPAQACAMRATHDRISPSRKHQFRGSLWQACRNRPKSMHCALTPSIKNSHDLSVSSVFDLNKA